MSEGNFDFQSYEEYPEELDYSNFPPKAGPPTAEKPCPNCKKPIPKNAISCLYCGQSVSFLKRPKWIFWTAIFVLIAFILLFVF